MSNRITPAWLKWPEIKQLVAAFSGKAELRFVGGAVRDALLGISVQDVDAATPMTPEKVMALLKKAGIKAVPTGIDHGTVTAVIGKRSFEITTLRKDTACDGRHASVEYTDDWEEDARRRDFTMNALYLSPAGELYDYFEGVGDARAGRVRFIGNPADRIKEDYLRILRYFRFFARYGQGGKDKATLAACADAASHIDGLSGERIQKEMLKLLSAPRAADAVQLMQQAGIMQHTLGFATEAGYVIGRWRQIESTLRERASAPYLGLALLLLGPGLLWPQLLSKIATRLALSNAMLKQMRLALSYEAELRPGTPLATQKRILRLLGKDAFRECVILAWAAGSDPIAPDDPYAEMLQLAQQWKIPKFPVGGDDLVKLGLKPGKEMGELLQRLEDEWEMSDYTLTKKQLLAKL